MCGESLGEPCELGVPGGLLPNFVYVMYFLFNFFWGVDRCGFMSWRIFIRLFSPYFFLRVFKTLSIYLINDVFFGVFFLQKHQGSQNTIIGEVFSMILPVSLLSECHNSVGFRSGHSAI